MPENVGDKYGLADMPYEQLLKLWHACRDEFVGREKRLVKQFRIGHPVQIRVRGQVLHGVVTGRNIRSISVGVLTGVHACRYRITPFHATPVEENSVAALGADIVCRAFHVTREEDHG